MNSSTLRRLASDQASLRRATPPNYLFPPDSDLSSLPDDLTQLTVLVTGAQGTAYSQGLWRLHLSMPDDYPKNPPKATFKTRIYHPNVEESSGAVCLDTLKKDWQSKLTLRDILITISCLLIHPNPDSALNSAAGALLQEDYEAFARQARLLTSIHAPIPPNLKEAVLEATRRGEERGSGQQCNPVEQPKSSGSSSTVTSVVAKNQTMPNAQQAREGNAENSSPKSSSANLPDDPVEDDAKENDPYHSPSPMYLSHESSRRDILGKRPLSELPTPIDPDDVDASNGQDEKTPHNRLPTMHNNSSGHARKSPKLDISAGNLDGCGKLRRENSSLYAKDDDDVISPATDFGDDKENREVFCKRPSSDVTKTETQHPVSQASDHHQRLTLRKVSNIGPSRLKGQARIGIRRL